LVLVALWALLVRLVRLVTRPSLMGLFRLVVAVVGLQLLRAVPKGAELVRAVAVLGQTIIQPPSQRKQRLLVSPAELILVLTLRVVGAAVWARLVAPEQQATVGLVGSV
jgi:hypothetical protein